MKRVAAMLLLLAACAAPPRTVAVRIASESHSVVFKAEVADTPDAQRRGLMGRQTLGPRAGMLFVWEVATARTFWMKDTLVGLDVVSIRAGRVVAIATMVPCRAEPCPITRTPPADAALEVAAGQAAAAGIAIGSLVDAPGLL